MTVTLVENLAGKSVIADGSVRQISRPPGSVSKQTWADAGSAAAQQDTEGCAVKIGQLAREAGVSVDTIRFYERRGLLPEPQRTPSGYRLYTQASAARIRRVRQLQGLGLSLDEVISALDAHDAGQASCQTQRSRLEAALDRVDARIVELSRLRDSVRSALAACDAGTGDFADPAAAG